ncbi:MAG: polysaccharide biosynthesis protein [Cyclobacteriaceae bacterium]
MGKSFKKHGINSAVIILGEFILKIKGLIIIPFLVKLWGMETYGVFIQLILVYNITGSLSRLGLPGATRRYVSPRVKKQKLPTFVRRCISTVLYASAIQGLLNFFLCAAILFGLNQFFFDLVDPTFSYCTLGLAFSTIIWNCFFGISQSLKMFKRMAVLKLIYELFPYVILISSILLGGTKTLSALVFSATYVFISIVYVIVFFKEFFILKPSLRIYRIFLLYGWPLSLNGIQGGLLGKSDRFFISYFLGSQATGLYHIVYTMASISEFVFSPIRKQLEVYSAIIWEKSHKKALELLIDIGRLMIIMTISLSVYLSLNINDMLNLLTSRSGEQMGHVAGIIAVGVGFSLFRNLYYLFVKLNKKLLFNVKVQLTGLVFNVLLNLVLIPAFGLIGAAYSTMLSYFSMLFILELKLKLGLFRIIGLQLLIIPIFGFLIDHFVPTSSYNTPIGLVLYSMIFLLIIAILPTTLLFLRHLKKYLGDSK